MDLCSSSRVYMWIAAAWILLVVYSILLTSVAESIIDILGIVGPDENMRQILVFLYGLAIVSFLGGSQIPAVFLKKRSFIIQFGFSAAFGFMLLLIGVLNGTILRSLNDDFLRPFFLNYPVIAIEYLSIPYIFMIFIDLFLAGRFRAFSCGQLTQSMYRALIHPRQAFESILFCSSILFSFVCTILVSAVWMLRAVVFSQLGFLPVRWRLFPFRIDEHLGIVSKTLLVIPVTLAAWVTMSFLLHAVVARSGCSSRRLELASLLGFAFLPSVFVLPVDLLEFGLQIEESLVADVAFSVAGLILLVLWPLTLAAIAVRTSDTLSWRRAIASSTVVFMPFAFLLALIFV